MYFLLVHVMIYTQVMEVFVSYDGVNNGVTLSDFSFSKIQK